eukprot:scaffold7910_cov16-Tisochrysis_lutea.AAC.2
MTSTNLFIFGSKALSRAQYPTALLKHTTSCLPLLPLHAQKRSEFQSIKSYCSLSRASLNERTCTRALHETAGLLKVGQQSKLLINAS